MKNVISINNNGEIKNHGYCAIEGCKSALEMRGFKCRKVRNGFNVIVDNKIVVRWRVR